MTQLIAFKNDNIACLCVDSNLVKEEKSFTENKLFKGDGFFIAAAGVAFGIDILEGLVSKSNLLGIKTIEAITEYLLSVGNNQYLNFLNLHANKLIKELIRLYILYIAFDEEGKLQIGMVGTENDEKLRQIKVLNVITVPRRLGIEVSLNKLVNADDAILMDYFSKGMNNIAKIDNTVKPPFFLGMLFINGFMKTKAL